MFRRALIVSSLFFAATAAAFSGGVNSQSFSQATGCNSCHNNPLGMPAPTVALTPSSATATPGQALTLTFVIENASQSAAGLNLRASAGTLTQIDAATQMTGAEITHQLNGKPPTNGSVTFTASWTAPATSGNVTFTAWGNSVNLNSVASGDRAASATASVMVQNTCSPSAELCDGIDNNCNQLIDDMALCPAGQQCVSAACVSPDAGTADAGTVQDAGTQTDGGAGGGSGGVIGGGGPSGGGGSADEDGQGCGCSGVGGGSLALFGMFALLLRSRRRAD